MTGSLRDPLRPRKGALHQFYLIYPSICILLVTDVLANHFFIPTHCGHEISPCPEVLPDDKILLEDPSGNAIELFEPAGR
jgi:hypothetical protein